MNGGYIKKTTINIPHYHEINDIKRYHAELNGHYGFVWRKRVLIKTENGGQNIYCAKNKRYKGENTTDGYNNADRFI